MLYDHAGEFAAANPADFAVALDILRSSVASWRDTATPMTVLLRGAGRARERRAEAVDCRAG